MDPYLRGIVPGLAFGIWLGGALMRQPQSGWLPVLVAVVAIAFLTWADYAYVHRNPGAAA